MNTSSFDLNHARSLHHLLEEAHVTRAARKLGITPAAASNALRRLRDELGDPLLVRSGRMLVRTPRAEELRQPAREVMLAAARLFERGRPFDPRTASWELVVTTSDRVAELLLPVLERRLRDRAPRVRLSVRTTLIGVTARLREQGGFAIVPAPLVERDLRTELLFVEDFVCVVRKRHPFARGRLTVKRLAQLEHVLVAPLETSSRSVVDVLLAERGHAREVARVVTSFSLVPPLLAGSDRVAVLPRTFAEIHARRFGLAIHPVPLPVPAVQMQLAWHVAGELDPRHLWTRQLLHDVVKERGLRP